MRSFESHHPAVPFLHFVFVIIISMFASSPLIAIISFAGALLFLISIRGGKKSDGVFYAVFFLIVAISNPLFSHNGVTPLFFLNGNPVTLEAIAYGVFIACVMVGVLLWCKCLTAVMTSDKILCLFAFAKKLSLTLSMVLRFVPLFKRRMKNLKNAQKTLGAYSSESIFDRIRISVKVFVACVSRSLEESMDTSLSMEARGYSLKGKTAFSLYKFTASDAALIILSAILFAISFYGLAGGAQSFYFYPNISYVDFSTTAVITYCAYFVLAFLPFIIEAKEAFRWKYSISKI